jgi:hypothetical protein
MKLTIDPAALEEARRDLGLSLDTLVEFDVIQSAHARTFTAGRYDGVDPFHGWHRITINERQTTTAASAALWHELTHALQCERIGSWPRYDALYRQQTIDAGLQRCTNTWSMRHAHAFEQEAWNATALAKAGALALLVYACD